MDLRTHHPLLANNDCSTTTVQYCTPQGHTMACKDWCRAADSSMLEQCATYIRQCLFPTRLLLRGSRRCYSGCGDIGAIVFTCMTARHDRRAILSHLCCGLCAIQASWTVGPRRADRLEAYCFEMSLSGVQEWTRA